MHRSLWKGLPYHKITDRNYTIQPHNVGQTVLLTNGKITRKKFILPAMLGYKLGQYFATRRIVR